MRFSLLWCVAFSIAPLEAQTTDTVRYTVLTARGFSGVQQSWVTPDGRLHFYFTFDDRGRGPALRQTVALNAEGFPTAVDITGHDYLNVPVSEHFAIRQSNGTFTATWRSAAESSSAVLRSPAFYVPVNDAAVSLLPALLLRAPGGRVALLPSGEASLERIRDVAISLDDRHRTLTLYGVHGLGFTPMLWWADERNQFFASGDNWRMVIRAGAESLRPHLLREQAAYDSTRGLAIARSTIRRQASVLFRNARLLDMVTGAARTGMSVRVVGSRIDAVGPDGSLAPSAPTTVIDVGGKTLMPGLWDMHVHVGDIDGLLHIAGGVTSVRDLGPDVDESVRYRERYADGTLVGPRMILGGFMDGPGPFAGPTKVLVSSPDSARAWVNRFADLDYRQVKVYSSLDTALIPLIVAEAHRRGMRVSGHVPEGMTAEEFVRAGADEIQHVNFLFLNFWRDSVRDTRTPERFTAPAERAALLSLDSDRVRRFVRLLRERNTVVDPTLNVFENLLANRPRIVNPGYAAVADLLPPFVARSLRGGGLPVSAALDNRYRDSFKAMQRMVKVLYDAGVPLVAGTDNLAGYALHRELELFAESGIPPADVLRIATIDAARLMGRDRELGSITPGKLADIIIVDGKPDQSISDIRRVSFVMKDGNVHDLHGIYESIGARPIGRLARY